MPGDKEKPMSVLQSDVLIYGSANMPDVDGLTAGGAVDFTKRVVFNDITPNGLMDYVSSSASDTAATIALTGADASGATVSENKTFNGATLVSGSQTFSELLKGVIGGTTAVGDLAAISHTAVETGTAQAGAAATATAPAQMTLASGQGASAAAGMIVRITNNSPSGVQNQLRQIMSVSGDVVTVNRDWGTVPSSATTYSIHHGMMFDLSPNQVTQVRRPFYQVAADVAGGSTRTFYEKVFAVNNNTATSLTGAAILKQVDPSSGTLEFALTNALNDSGTVANRQTAPSSGVTAFSTGSAPQSINVPSPQNLPSGAAPNSAGAQGVWLSLQLTAGLAPAKTSFTLRATGATR
jgi:hypothetical protein